MTRLDRLLAILDKYDALAASYYESRQYLLGYETLMKLREEKEKLVQELTEHGYRRKD